jgi:hypothetical protein
MKHIRDGGRIAVSRGFRQTIDRHTLAPGVVVANVCDVKT